MSACFQPAGVPAESPTPSFSSVMNVTTKIASSRRKPSLHASASVPAVTACTIASIGRSVPAYELTPTCAAHSNAADSSGSLLSM